MEKNNYGLEEIQKMLLQDLDKLDSICRANNIRYSLHGGTLLGAARNQKIIPWDDDIDVSMLRSQYYKFKTAAKELSGNYYLDEKTMWFPRLVMKTDDGGLAYVDILIWDYISENKLAQFLKINLLRAMQGMMKSSIEYKKFTFINKTFLFITHTFGKLFTQSRKQKIFHFVAEKTFQGKHKFIHRSNDAFVGVSYIFDKDYMNGYGLINLEGKQYMVNKRYHEFLERNYGKNYLTPPPLSERVPAHENFRKRLKDT